MTHPVLLLYQDTSLSRIHTALSPGYNVIASSDALTAGWWETLLAFLCSDCLDHSLHSKRCRTGLPQVICLVAWVKSDGDLLDILIMHHLAKLGPRYLLAQVTTLCAVLHVVTVGTFNERVDAPHVEQSFETTGELQRDAMSVLSLRFRYCEDAGAFL
jgi:hypothetical protein